MALLLLPKNAINEPRETEGAEKPAKQTKYKHFGPLEQHRECTRSLSEAERRGGRG